MNKNLLISRLYKFTFLFLVLIASVCAYLFYERTALSTSDIINNLDYIDRKQRLEKLVAQGDAKAQYDLASTYIGPGVSVEDKERKLNLLQKSAAQGYDNAQYDLARYYNNSYYKNDYNPKKSFQLFSESANKGNIRAQYELGLMYRDGQGVEKDFFKALEIFTNLAKQSGNEAGSTRGVIANLYKDGDGDKFKKSAFDSYKWALTADYDISRTINEVLPLLSDEEKQKAKIWANDFKTKYPHKEFGSQDIEILREIYKDTPNHIEAEYKVALMTLNGDRLIKDPTDAMRAFKRLAERGHAKSKLELARLYFKGEKYIGINYSESYMWFLASEQKDMELKKVKDKLSIEEIDKSTLLANKYNNKYPPRNFN